MDYNDRNYQDGDGGQERGFHNPPPLLSEKLIADRKVFFLDLKENNRGRVLKITEDVRGRRDTIMVPAELLPELADALNRIIDFERGIQ